MLKKLRVKVVCIVMAIVLLMLAAIMIMVVHYTQSNLKTESLRVMESLAVDPMQLGAYSEGGNELLPYFVLQFGRRNEVLAINGGYFDLSNDAVLQDLINRTYYCEASEGELTDYNLRYYRRTTWNACNIVFADLSMEQRTVTKVRNGCIAIGLISLTAFLIISLLLARWAVKPVERAWKQQREFVSDASHELKTPLTVILTNAELLQQPEYDMRERSTFSSNILTMAGQMRGLVESLLDLARVDNGLTHAAWERVALSTVVSDATLPFEPLYFEKGLTLQSDIDEGLFVNGSGTHLCHVVEILLDNAQKYSTSPAVVRVSLHPHGRGQCLLTVENPGDPIGAEELKNIFKRFYRTDQARSRDGSYGLGLSIAEGIVREHRGRIWAASVGGLNSFYVTLPTV